MATTKKRKKDSAFAKNLKTILEDRNISQKAAADLAGVKKNVLNDWLSGTNPADLGAVQRLATALDCDFEWLLTGVTSKRQKIEDFSMNQLFDIEQDSSFSGLYFVEAKKLTRKKPIKKEGVE